MIEHVPRERRAAFAAELRRVARAGSSRPRRARSRSSPHALLPFAHWLPPALRRPYWRLGAQGHWEDIALLGRREMEAPVRPGRAERVGPLTKSWVCVRPVPG